MNDSMTDLYFNNFVKRADLSVLMGMADQGSPAQELASYAESDEELLVLSDYLLEQSDPRGEEIKQYIDMAGVDARQEESAAQWREEQQQANQASQASLIPLYESLLGSLSNQYQPGGAVSDNALTEINQVLTSMREPNISLKYGRIAPAEFVFGLAPSEYGRRRIPLRVDRLPGGVFSAYEAGGGGNPVGIFDSEEAAERSLSKSHFNGWSDKFTDYDKMMEFVENWHPANLGR